MLILWSRFKVDAFNDVYNFPLFQFFFFFFLKKNVLTLTSYTHSDVPTLNPYNKLILCISL